MKNKKQQLTIIFDENGNVIQNKSYSGLNNSDQGKVRDIVGDLFGATVDTLEKIGEKSGTPGTSIATKPFAILDISYSYLQYLDEERRAYGDLGHRDEIVAGFQTAGKAISESVVIYYTHPIIALAAVIDPKLGISSAIVAGYAAGEIYDLGAKDFIGDAIRNLYPDSSKSGTILINNYTLNYTPIPGTAISDYKNKALEILSGVKNSSEGTVNPFDTINKINIDNAQDFIITKKGSSLQLETNDVDFWVKSETNHKIKALEKSSKIFDKTDALTVGVLEALYGEASGFGNLRFLGIRGGAEAAGQFMLTKEIAEKYGLTIKKSNDERFDVDQSSIVAGKYLKDLDNSFRIKTNLTDNISTIPVSNNQERLKFTIAAYKLNPDIIAVSQDLVQGSGFDPGNWNDIEKYLNQSGLTESQSLKTSEYINKILENQKELSKKSKANKKLKDKKPAKEPNGRANGHWITNDDGNHVFIEDK